MKVILAAALVTGCVFPAAQGRNVAIVVKSTNSDFAVERRERRCDPGPYDTGKEVFDHLMADCQLKLHGYYYYDYMYEKQ